MPNMPHDFIKAAIEIEVANTIQLLDLSQNAPPKDKHMTADDSAHLVELMCAFVHLAIPKYINGKAEHGGSLRKMSTIDRKKNLIDELVDGFIYAKDL